MLDCHKYTILGAQPLLDESLLRILTSSTLTNRYLLLRTVQQGRKSTRQGWQLLANSCHVHVCGLNIQFVDPYYPQDSNAL